MRNLLSILFCLPFLFISCGSDDDDVITLKESSKELKSGSTYQIEATSGYDITYTVENAYYATVDTKGLVTALRIGETKIKISSNGEEKTFNVKVTPTSKLYEEPNLEFGISRADLIKKLGKPEEETDESIIYTTASNAAPITFYFFDLNKKLEQTGMLISSVYSKDAATFLSERYVYVGVSDDETALLFINNIAAEKATMLVAFMNSNSKDYYQVVYMPYTHEKSMPETDSRYSKYTEAVDKYLSGLQ